MNEAKVLEEMKRLKGTQTEKNLRAAYAGESQAHVKYNLFANEAEKDPECSRQIADLFRETANNERAHAKIWFWLVGDLKKTTAEHLKMAAEGEHDEWTSMYPEFAETAKKEGFPQIAFLFSKVGEIEKSHEARYKLLLANVENGQVFKKGEKKLWMCANCGYTVESVEAPRNARYAAIREASLLSKLKTINFTAFKKDSPRAVLFIIPQKPVRF